MDFFILVLGIMIILILSVGYLWVSMKKTEQEIAMLKDFQDAQSKRKQY